MMINMQRYKIFEIYKGKFNSRNALCCTDSVSSAQFICAALKDRRRLQGRECCFDYEIVKVANDYIDFLDSVEDLPNE